MNSTLHYPVGDAPQLRCSPEFMRIAFATLLSRLGPDAVSLDIEAGVANITAEMAVNLIVRVANGSSTGGEQGTLPRTTCHAFVRMAGAVLVVHQNLQDFRHHKGSMQFHC